MEIDFSLRNTQQVWRLAYAVALTKHAHDRAAQLRRIVRNVLKKLLCDVVYPNLEHVADDHLLSDHDAIAKACQSLE